MRKAKMFVLLSLCLICIAGCNNLNKHPEVEDLINDYNSYFMDNSPVVYNQAEVIREQLFKESKNYVAEVKFLGKDNYANYERVATLTYNYYDNIGWTLDGVSSNSFEIKCFKGRTIQDLENDIQKNKNLFSLGSCTEITVCKASDVFNDNTQIFTLKCLRQEGNVIGTYDNTELLFTYKNGNWEFTNIDFGNASNYYFNLVGTKWRCVDYGRKKDEIIEIISVSEDSRTIDFKYGNISFAATFVGEYNDFRRSHVAYIPNEKIYLGTHYYGYKEFEVYLEKIHLATFAGAGHNYTYLDGLMEGFNGHDPIVSYDYELVK